MGDVAVSVITARNSSCGKVMFSQASVILSTVEGGCTPLAQITRLPETVNAGFRKLVVTSKN